MKTFQTSFSYSFFCFILFISCKDEKATQVQNVDEIKKPNFVIIMADDMGYSDASCYGSEIPTPGIDSLAAEGMKFARFYNAGRCCPSRASLLTGLYPHRAGMGWMTDDEQHPSYQGHLTARCMTIAELLRSAGYKNYIAGKWHVGDSMPDYPLQRGFDSYWGINRGGKSHFYDKDFKQDVLWNNTVVHPPKTGWYIGDSITEHAVNFVKNHQNKYSDRPFFLYVAYTAPHWPLHAPEEDIKPHKGKYRNGWTEMRQERLRRLKELNLITPKTLAGAPDSGIPDWKNLNETQKQEWERKMEVHAAMITNMDAGIAKIMKTLKDEKLDENTVIIFLSDNGASNESFEEPSTKHVPAGQHGSMKFIGSEWAHACNSPFKSYKSWTYEGGISTPLIIKYPGKITPGRTTEHVGHIMDLAPTLAEMAGISLPDTFNGNKIPGFDGNSLVPIFDRGARTETYYCWEHEGNRAVMLGDWKLVSKINGYWADPLAPEGAWELYNMHKDRGETVNVAAFHPKKVQSLEAIYEKWAADCGVLPHAVHLQQRKRVLGRYGW